MRILLVALVLSAGAWAQQAGPQPALPMTDEEVAAVFNRLSQGAVRMQPMLDQLHPTDWIAKGAPDTYLAQWTSVREQYHAIQSDMSDLAQGIRNQTPERLTESMKALFRMQSAQSVLGSLMGGVRKYQNPALADVIESVAAEATGDIDRLEKHLVELADEKEQQYTVVDHEAQRCRATLSRQPAAPAGTSRKSQ
jgi:hypothetical protein